MTNAINMLPCPMCGCSSINIKNEQPTDNSGGYFIECPDCGISTSLRYACGDDPIPLLAEQWNRRATAQCLHQIAEPQPEALRLAAWLLHRGMSGIKQNDIEASNQLRWLHAESLQHQQELAAYRFTVENREARIAELEAELEAVGAGGVEPLRKGFVRLTDVLARLEQGFGANSAPVTTIKRHFEMQPQPAQHAITTAAGRAGSVYVSGPMTGYADWNFPAFNAAAAALRAQGLQVINPADHGVVDGAEWADYLRTDLAQLAACERIHLLPGWSKSKGVKLELHVAQALGLQITLAEGAEPLGAAAPQAVQAAVPKWIDDPHDIEQGQMLNPEWVKLQQSDTPAHPAEGVPAPVEVGEREALRDGAWYWVERETWGNETSIAPAMYKANCDAWYSYQFGGIPTRHLKVLAPCLMQARAALAATHPTQQGLDAREFPAMTPELASILGLPCFQCIPFAKALRAAGHTIKTRAEDEQAAVLHWMLGHYFRHGDDWSGAAAQDMSRMKAAAIAAQAKQGGAA